MFWLARSESHAISGVSGRSQSPRALSGCSPAGRKSGFWRQEGQVTTKVLQCTLSAHHTPTSVILSFKRSTPLPRKYFSSFYIQYWLNDTPPNGFLKCKFRNDLKQTCILLITSASLYMYIFSLQTTLDAWQCTMTLRTPFTITSLPFQEWTHTVPLQSLAGNPPALHLTRLLNEWQMPLPPCCSLFGRCITEESLVVDSRNESC